MESHCLASIIFVIFLSVTIAEANQYFVGGSKDIGWNDKPKKLSYNHWSKKTRFNVDDTIVFTYPFGKDKVLYVREEDYKKCDNKNPVKTWDGGYNEVSLFRTGIYHFIGGNDGSCQKGQRLIVFVPEVQSPPGLTPAAAPSQLTPSVPSTPPPTQTPPSPVAHTPAAAPSPLSPPVPSTPPPTQTPPFPAPHTPATAPSPLSPPVPSSPPPTQILPSPASHTPATAPSPLSPPVPSTPPPSPAPHTPAAAPSPPPTQKAPSFAPSITQPPESSPPPAPPTAQAPSTPSPQPSAYAPAPAPSSAWSLATRSMLTPVVGLLFGVLFY